MPFCIPLGFYQVDVLKCYDGDTLTLSCRDDQFISGRYFNPRLYGIDSAERKRSKTTHIEELQLMSQYDECLVARLLLSDDFPVQIEERVVIQTVPNKQGSIDTRDKYGRPLCRVFVEISERVIEVLSEFDIPNVFDLSNPEHLALYVIDDTMMCVQERDIKLAHSDSGTFFSLADLLIGYGFSIGYDGGTKICHYDRFSIDPERMSKLYAVSELLKCEI
jgi:hypothetical protein